MSKSKFPKDITGFKFGRLTVMSIDESIKKGRTYWLCKCECNNIKSIQRDSLTGDRTFSCGCLQKENASKARKTHGLNRTRFYQIWANMLQRCTNENNNAYHNYGGRGIEVCEEWYVFDNFMNDMYDSYKNHINNFGEKDTTIERMNVDSNYCKENCTWDTCRNQRINQRNKRFIVINDKEYSTFKDIADDFNLKERTVKDRFYKGKRGLDLVKQIIRN